MIIDDEKYYRGDTFGFDITAEENGADYVFAKNEIVKIGMKTDYSKGSKYLLFKEIKVENPIEEIHVEFEPELTKKLPLGISILEVELTDSNNKVQTIFQDKIKIEGDIIND